MGTDNPWITIKTLARETNSVNGDSFMMKKKLDVGHRGSARFSKTPAFVLILWVLAFTVCAHHEANSQFANGADIGWLSQMEAAGYVFKDNSGVQKNCLDILKGKGINALRFRVWVNPSGAYCGKKDVASMAHRADSAGFKVMLDFHFSDTWADPGHQAKPAAWVSHAFPVLLTDVYNHVRGMLDTLKSLGVVPAWVQIGNETNDGMLWEDGKAYTHMSNFARLVDTGYGAVKAVDSSIQVIVHLSNGHDDAMYRWMFDGLKNNGARWDIIGMSVYPYWANLPWPTDDSLALVTMKDMITRYQTKVMVVETGYLYDQAPGAKLFLVDLLAKTKSVCGLGVFYWEPESYNWQGYQLGAWDPSTKAPTAAMDAFLSGATFVADDKWSGAGGFELHQNYPNPFNPSTAISFQLSEVSFVALKVSDLLGREVTTLVNEVRQPGIYTVQWDASGKTSGVYLCRLFAGGSIQTRKLILVK
jgi:arabinogalactan endo-1,4-beta-galactosidase